MAYENINVTKLKTALNKIDNINYDSINNLNNKLNSEQWQSPVRNRVKTALNEIVKEYKNIQNDIKKYKQVTELIKKYQDSLNNYNNYSRKAQEYKQKYYTYYYKSNPDANDEYLKKYYKNKYDEYLNKQSKAKNNKNSLERQIKSSIN